MSDVLEAPLDELGIARAMARGEIDSPQRYENISLFALRITGTGMAYRSAIKEFVWRDRDLYLNDEFLARCNGLAVVWEHPERAVLNTEEYANRVVGAIMLPYIQGEDVWGIAKIHDAEAAKLMSEGQLSTSPGVVFRDPTVNTKRLLEDGAKLLIEGKPSLLDHLAVCELGVWDKAGPPVGVLNESLERADSMSDDNTKRDAAADAAKADAEKARADSREAKLDAFMDAVSSRLDAMEARDKERCDAEVKAKADAAESTRKADAAKRDAEREEWKKADAKQCALDDAEEEKEKGEFEGKGEPKDDAAAKARSARKDRMKARSDAAAKAKADEDEKEEEKEEKKDAIEAKAAKADWDEKEKEEEKEKKDSARADSATIAEMRREIETLKRRTAPLPETDRAIFADVQAKADAVYMALGTRAPAHMSGEDIMAYRKRLLRPLRKHSPNWKDIDPQHLTAEVLAVAESQVYADADIAARNPSDVEPGTLREIVKVDPSTGQRMVTFVGPQTFIHQMSRPSRRVVAFNTKTGG